jgi:hypothetical protein
MCPKLPRYCGFVQQCFLGANFCILVKKKVEVLTIQTVEYFDRFYLFFCDNLVFSLHFNVRDSFNKFISHNGFTKFGFFITQM